MPTRSGAPCLGHPRLPTPSSNEFLEEQANANTLSTSSTKRKRTAASENKVFIAPVKTPRKKANTTKRAPAKTVDPTDEALDPKPEPKPKKPRTKKPEQEKRLKMFRKHAPQTYLEKLARATSQRMFVVSSLVNWTDEYPIMEFGMAGTTGNLYTITIGKVPSCSCPDNQKGNHCKHICYVLNKALKAPAHLQYQLAFLSTELIEIYNGSSLSRETKPEENTTGKRKPIEGDCPVCFMEFEPDKEDIVWCRGSCGNNIHKVCFDKWAATQREHGVRCVYCRAQWEFETESLNMDELKKTGRVNDEGYVNVADQLGLSGERDSSTYYQPWGYRGSYYYGQRRYRY
ncbi:RING finger protein [Aspergillus ruber CBS 135680]|uniref:Uncharacterized protein n=1 Tax=Aspergillus ruber (strain CBS 135680) TaxID=1388766 RepID=A0A017SNJ8_ASPRC|nr:uncharacterized protein EURHEDRAFT_409133 [Aspergillus ruber CBS 135680]EYE97855.1 hypothetical protein EURHEDRAFT_409133 [Aspergillus ruber CBS 135680]